MPDQDAASAPSFEQALSDLQRIASDLESGGLGLEQSLAQFERGVGLLRHCRRVLDDAERKIEVLTGADAAGNPTFAPFDSTATAQQQGPAAGRRPRRRTKSPPESNAAPANVEPTSAEPQKVESPKIEPALSRPEADHSVSRHTTGSGSPPAAAQSSVEQASALGSSSRATNALVSKTATNSSAPQASSSARPASEEDDDARGGLTLF